MKNKLIYWSCCLSLLVAVNTGIAQVQSDSVQKTRQYKNVIRYNLSGALLFGFDRYLVLGYERIIKQNQSISLNIGRAALPNLISIETDSFNVVKDKKSSGFNVSVDYRFYLAKENKHQAPRGVYIGPYYSYCTYERDNQWELTTSSTNDNVDTHTKLNIHTLGFELGYQFILWKRLALDMVLVGPGFGFYRYKATFEGNMNAEEKEQLREGLKQLLTQKYPGMNLVFADKEISSDGVMKTNTMGYRYIIHIGYNF